MGISDDAIESVVFVYRGGGLSAGGGLWINGSCAGQESCRDLGEKPRLIQEVVRHQVRMSTLLWEVEDCVTPCGGLVMKLV